MTGQPDIVILMTDQERAAPVYETDEIHCWRREHLHCERWFAEHGVRFDRHYTGSLACVPSRPTLFTGQYPDLHGVTQTDGLAKQADDSRMRWLPPGQVPTLGNWFRAAGYDTHYDGKWHISHADLHRDGKPLATCDRGGTVDPAAVQAYLDADPLAPYGFSGWVGPEPHGAPMANTGLRRDPLIADRVVAWLEDRYERRRGGDADAQRPFLLVASFVNPHDICLFPAWAARSPLRRTDHEPPTVPPPPTADEDLTTKPDAHRAYRDALFSGFAGMGAAAAAATLFDVRGDAYRQMYYRLHLEVDGPLERVRRLVVEGSDNAVLVRTADHGELLGAHGGLHQKWFNLYDEAARVPFAIARTGARTTASRVVAAPSSHVDLVPTLLAVAGIDEVATADALARDFTEVHPLPGRNLLPIVDGAEPEPDRPVYLQTRDNILEGDSRASVAAGIAGLRSAAPPLLRVAVPSDVGASFEGVVVRVPEKAAVGGAGHHWKLVRTFDDPDTWTEPGRRHLSSSGLGGERHRTEPLDDQWELYDLTADPIEAENRWPDASITAVRDHVLGVLVEQRQACLPVRNNPWPYARRRPATSTVPWPADLVARVRSAFAR